MKTPSPFSRLTLALLLIFAAPSLWAQGPPFQADDPVPVDFQHYEFYIFGAFDGTPVALAPAGPAFEFNWGALPNVQIHAILPDRRGWLLPLQKTQHPTAVCLRALHRRSDGKLRLSRHVLDLGER